MVNTNNNRKNAWGGSAGAGGYSFQAEACALVSAKMIAEIGLDWAKTDCESIPVRLSAETGSGGDDFRVYLKSGKIIEVQAKSGVQKNDNFWEALLNLARVVATQPGTYGVLLTNNDASGPIRKDLKNDMVRVGQSREDDLKTITREFLAKLDGEKIDQSVCRRLFIVVRDFGSTNSGESHILDVLRFILSDPSKCNGALAILYRDGMMITEERGARDKQAILDKLYQANIRIKIPGELGQKPLEQIIQSLQDAIATNKEGQGVRQELRIRDAQNHLQQIREHWSSINLRRAFEASQQFSEWISEHGEELPQLLRGESYALLFEVETSRLIQNEHQLSNDEIVYLKDLGEKAKRAIQELMEQQTEPSVDIIHQQIGSLNALVISHESGADAGLALLEGKSNPFALRRYLAILIVAKRFEQAFEVIKGIPIHEEWADKAAAIFAVTGNYDDVFRTIETSRESDNQWLPLRCAISAADYLRATVLPEDNDLEQIVPENLDEQMRGKLQAACQFLEAVTKPIILRNQRPTPTEDIALQKEVFIRAWLGELDYLPQISGILERVTPLPLLLPYLVEQGFLTTKDDWVYRLRKEYPDDFDTQVLACAIEPITPENAESAFERLFQLAMGSPIHTLDSSKRHFISARLAELAQQIGTSPVKARLQTAEALLLADDALALKRNEAVRLINEGKIAEAVPLVEQSRDDSSSLWLQCEAAIQLNRGDIEAGFRTLKKAISLNPYPNLIRHAASIAVQANELEEAINLLERYLSRRPSNLGARTELASLCFRVLDFSKAAEQLAILCQQQPEEVQFRINYAMALAQIGDMEAGLKILAPICDLEGASLEAVLRYAFLQKASGNPQLGFETLNRHRDQFWEEPQYLMALMNAGFASGQEKIAHEAMMQVQQLQSTGKASGLLWEQSVDDFVQIIAERHERSQEAMKMVQFGHLPWLSVDQLLNLTWMESWHNRTRQYDWIGEQPFSQAATAVYATDTLVIRPELGIGRIYEPVRTPKRRQAIVADISALLTCYYLGILEQVADYFGQVLIPSTYLAYSAEQAERLVLRQRSQREAYRSIKKAIDHNKISVLSPPSPATATITTDEELLGKDSSTVVMLRDVLTLLTSEGNIPEQLLAEYNHLIHQRTLTETHIHSGQELCCDLAALTSLAATPLLEPVLEGFSICIAPSDRDAIITNIEAIELQEKLHKDHLALWQTIRDDQRFIKVTYSTAKPIDSEDSTTVKEEVGIASALLARQKGLPLLADDRVCQNFIHYDSQVPEECFAFGSDAMLLAMYESGTVTLSRLSDLYIQLIRWRYRFLVPPSSVLKDLAMRFINSAPGKSLRDIANYVHDCFHDSGLPLRQASDQPTSAIAGRLFMEWVTVVTDFVSQIWQDLQVSEPQATAFTDWAFTELLPSPPRSLGPVSTFGPERVPDFVFSYTLIQLARMPDKSRAHNAMRTIARNLGVADRAFMRRISEVINEI